MKSLTLTLRASTHSRLGVTWDTKAGFFFHFVIPFLYGHNEWELLKALKKNKMHYKVVKMTFIYIF